MEVWVEQVESWLDSDEDCPYCGAYLKFDYMSDDCNPPDNLKCPACGKTSALMVEYEPSFGLFKMREDR